MNASEYAQCSSCKVEYLDKWHRKIVLDRMFLRPIPKVLNRTRVCLKCFDSMVEKYIKIDGEWRQNGKMWTWYTMEELYPTPPTVRKLRA